MANEYLNNKTFESIIKSFQFYGRERSRYELMIADLEETHKRRHNKYHDNLRKTELTKRKQEYEEVCTAFKEFQDQLACAFYLLSQNIANWARYSGIDIDDAIQDGVVICFEKINRFDPRKGKAFNYLSTCIINSLRQLYRSTKNYGELKKKYLNHLQEQMDSIIRNGREVQNFQSPDAY